MLSQCSTVATLKSLKIFEEGVLHFHFALGLINYVASCGSEVVEIGEFVRKNHIWAVQLFPSPPLFGINLCLERIWLGQSYPCRKLNGK